MNLEGRISSLEALAVGKACYARVKSYSMLNKREPGGGGGVLISAPVVPHCGSQGARVTAAAAAAAAVTTTTHTVRPLISRD